MGKIVKRRPSPDPKYHNVKVAKFINHVMKKGKKSVARKLVYGAFDEIERKTKKDPLEVFLLALGNIMPQREVRSKRVGGANYQVPYRVSDDRGTTLAMRWILEGSRKKDGVGMKTLLAQEIMDAADKKGYAMQKQHNVHRMAQANKAFAYLAR